MNTEKKIDRYLNERKKGSRSPRELADNLSARIERAIYNEVEDWKKETFDPVEGIDYSGQLDEALAITAKRMLNFFNGMKRGAQSFLKKEWK